MLCTLDILSNGSLVRTIILLLFCVFSSFVFSYELEEAIEITENYNFVRVRSTSELQHMLRAGKEIQAWCRLLDKTKTSLHDELMKAEKEFVRGRRYPLGDVRDDDTGCKYFYHAHREGEHGHFHLFVYEKVMPRSVKPRAFDDKRHVAHLVALSMDDRGFPKGFFTINQWVGGEAWYSAEDTVRLLPYYKITHTQPSYPLNRWIKQMLVLFRPQIESLLYRRDALIVEEQRKGRGLVDVLQDHSLEVLTSYDLSVEKQVYAIEAVLRERESSAQYKKD